MEKQLTDLEGKPITNVPQFENFLDSLSCEGCKHSLNGICNHNTKAEEREADKKVLVDHHNKIGKPFNIKWAKDINRNYTCRDFEQIS